MKHSLVIVVCLLCLFLLHPAGARTASAQVERAEAAAVERVVFHQMILKEREPSAKYGNHWRFFLLLGGVWQLPPSRRVHQPLFVRVKETDSSRAVLVQATNGVKRRVEMGSAYPARTGENRLDKLNIVRLRWRASNLVDVDTIDTLGGLSQAPDPIVGISETTYTLQLHNNHWEVAGESFSLGMSS